MAARDGTWVALALLSAGGSATSTLAIKRAVGQGGIVASTVAFRLVAALLLVGVVWAAGAAPALTPAYWRTTALVLPPEVGGMVFFSLALRDGELSVVQPFSGLIPVAVMVGGAIALHELPTAVGALGIVLVAAGVYTVGLRDERSALAPLRALVRSRASWYAVASAICWSATTVIHKFGIAEVGPFAWGVTVTGGSALLLALALPVLAWRSGASGIPRERGAWTASLLVAGVFFAVGQIGLHLSLRVAEAGYVIAVNSMSIVLATALGVVLLRERAGAPARVAGAALVTLGAILVATGG